MKKHYFIYYTAYGSNMLSYSIQLHEKRKDAEKEAYWLRKCGHKKVTIVRVNIDTKNRMSLKQLNNLKSKVEIA